MGNAKLFDQPVWDFFILSSIMGNHLIRVFFLTLKVFRLLIRRAGKVPTFTCFRFPCYI